MVAPIGSVVACICQNGCGFRMGVAGWVLGTVPEIERVYFVNTYRSLAKEVPCPLMYILRTTLQDRVATQE